MTSLSMRVPAILALLSLLLLPLPVQAQNRTGTGPAPAAKSDWDVTLGAGGGLAPTFEGSDRYRAVPLPLVNITYKDMISLSGEGLSAYWREGGLRIGAGLTYNGGRTDSEEDGFIAKGDNRLKGMGDIDAALGLKAFASYRLGMVEMKAAVTRYLGDDNDGLLVDLGLALPWKAAEKLTITPQVGTTWANRDYMRTFFGVSSDQAANTGFDRFDADAGFKDIRAGLEARYRIDEHWFVSVRAEVRQLLEDAAKSPISFSDTGAVAGALVGYKF